MSISLGNTGCQCMACGEYFNRVSTFDKHRVGEHGPERRCLTAEEMAAKGWSHNSRGLWITARREVAA